VYNQHQWIQFSIGCIVFYHLQYQNSPWDQFQNSAILKVICKIIMIIHSKLMSISLWWLLFINKLQHQIIFINNSLNIINHIYRIWTILTMYFIVKNCCQNCLKINRQKKNENLKFICKKIMINDIQNWCQLHSDDY
jgi:hypothetical protein